MNVKRVEKWKVVVPCRAGILERVGRWYDPGLSTFDAVHKWIIRIHAEGDLIGVGESSRGESEASIDSGIAAIMGQDPRRFALHRLPLPAEASYGTFEMALFDLLGKAWEVPAYQLLGGARQPHVLVDYWASRRGPEDTGRQAAEGRARGFRGIKIKAALAEPGSRLGSEEAQGVLKLDGGAALTSPGDHSVKSAVGQDDPIVERVAAIAEAGGPEFTITVDPNCRFYEPARALKLARALERFNVLVLEDPIPWRNNLDAYALLRQKSPLPVAIHVSTPDAVLVAIRKNAVDYLNINGSMADFVKMAWMAEQAGIRCWHGSGVDLGIRDMSYAHASFAAGNCTLPGDVVGNFLREDDLIMDPIPIENGYIPLPTTPGLGVELDETALRKYHVT
jgi:muconate cycloisomerase